MVSLAAWNARWYRQDARARCRPEDTIMKSPFPGMDPYIEVRWLWADFHADLIAEIKRSRAARLPERYFVQTGERFYVVIAGIDGKDIKAIYPDVAVEKPAADRRGARSRDATAVAEAALENGSVSMRAFIDEHFRENFIEIYEADPEIRLVTCIEILSPSNKRRGSEGWKQYLRKRNALLLGSANLVEIDLLRGGERMPMVERWPKSPYYLLVGRQSHVPSCRVWPAYFDRPLPEIPVPLAGPDPDIPLALQPMIQAVYDRSRYARRIDYAKPLVPALSAKEAAWLAQRFRTENPQSQPATPPKRRRRRE
jgi:hypothetical protein